MASLDHGLNLYSLAASAAGVGLLASALPAEAKIVYTPTHRTIKTHDVFHLDLNHDQIGDFLISNHSFCTADVCGRTLRALPAAGRNEVVGAKGIGGPFYAYALKGGVKIGPGEPFPGRLMAASGTEYGSVGPWFNVSDRYLGLKFIIKGRFHYGWARLSVIVGGGSITAALTGYAYETTPNEPIFAGKTEESEANVDEANPAALNERTMQLANLGLLAMGSPALSIWRREESPPRDN